MANKTHVQRGKNTSLCGKKSKGKLGELETQYIGTDCNVCKRIAVKKILKKFLR